jgi:hypothetical protein
MILSSFIGPFETCIGVRFVQVPAAYVHQTLFIKGAKHSAFPTRP